MSEILKDLRQQIAESRAVFVIGAGVSIAASGEAKVASWSGLLEHGIGRCQEIAAGLPSGWQERRLGDIQSGDTSEMISAAEAIVERLGGVHSGEYSRWLRETVGSLTAKRREVLEALRDLGVPLATTNYDGLLEEVTGRPAVTWQEPEKALRVLRGEEAGILHLHGFWREPKSVVLGVRSYGEVLGSVPAQSLQQILGLLHSLVFVGYGGGLEDPNFGSLLAWLRQHWSGAEHRHFRLCLEREREELRKAHTGSRIFPVAYGEDYSELGPWLRQLTVVPAPATPARVSLGGTTEPAVVPRRKLRVWPEPELPSRPYPVLLPYEHPALFAGREWELAKVRDLVDLPVPILGLFAVSGAGKSSLLAGGLVPALRASQVPAAMDRHPTEPGLASRLVGELFAAEGLEPAELAVLDREPARFAAWVREAQRLAGRPPVLVLDQFEDLFRGPDGQRARSTVGLLLAATLKRLPGEAAPCCRWLLACRRDFHGEVAAWLPDVLQEARAEGWPGVEGLPHDLSGHERFGSWDLPPLGWPPPGMSTADARGAAQRAFLDAIVRPLGRKAPDGRPAFPWTLDPEAAARLAAAFAEARERQPETPLVPQLQVVLARLLDESPVLAGTANPAPLRVPDDPGTLIDSALEVHLRRALERAFPAGRGGSPREGRSRALLALRELADQHGRKGEGLAAGDLARAVSSEGEAWLEALAAPESRILVPVLGPEGLRYVLSHDRLAQVVRKVVDEEARRGLVDADPEVLELHRFVAHQARFYAEGEKALAVQVPARRFRSIAARREALLWDDERRKWWQACVAQRRASQRRWWTWAAVGAALLLAAGLWGQGKISLTQEEANLRAALEGGSEASALTGCKTLREQFGMQAAEVGALLRKRKDLKALFEEGPASIEIPEGRSAAVLSAVEALLPALDAEKLDLEVVGALTWALDYFPARDRGSPANRNRALELRKAVEKSLRKRRGEPPAGSFEWASLDGGTFQMGSPSGEGGDDERPQHPVTVPPFRMLATEVTNRQFRRVFPDHEGPDDLPAVNVTWYQAYAFATWLGGRLPTDAEWEYAARAGCPHPYCDRHGNATQLDRVGWYDANSGGRLHPVGEKEPNPWGLYDLYGNAWEWTADWYTPYSAEPQTEPWGLPSGEYRVLRGGCFSLDAGHARAAYRIRSLPGYGWWYQGFRVCLPVAPS